MGGAKADARLFPQPVKASGEGLATAYRQGPRDCVSAKDSRLGADGRRAPAAGGFNRLYGPFGRRAGVIITGTVWGKQR